MIPRVTLPTAYGEKQVPHETANHPLEVPTMLRVRIYIIRGIALAASQDPFLFFRFGDTLQRYESKLDGGN